MVEFSMQENHDIISVNIETELKQSYLDYAMSVIVGRALPDVRDGLKPVHRRVLYAMYELNNDWNKPYKKSARIVGDVIGKYHPHGDTAVYDSIVRLAQPFSMRYPLVDGQGNFGSIDGDSAAAMRYTEVRMKKITHSLLADLEKETVDFQPNYDGNESAPCVLPTRVPNLLVNGTTGIAVGMATNIPPHNLSEVINGCIALIDNPDISFQEIIKHIPGPDFPTSSMILGRSGIINAYKTGKGRVVIRSRTHYEDMGFNKQRIIVDELPYQVNKARLIEKIAFLVKNKKIEGISELRDESDKDGIRVVIELKKNENADVILNNLFKQTQLQQVFSINMVALCDNQPRVLSLIKILQEFIRHRKDVVTKRCKFELNKARRRCHSLEGLGVALSNIDEMISIIKLSKNPQLAKQALQDKLWNPGIVAKLINSADDVRPINLAENLGLQDDGYRLSPEQAQVILDLRLHRLTALEQDKIIDEYQSILQCIFELLDILKDPEKLMGIIRQELVDIKEEFGDKRKTEITDSEIDISIEDLIDDEEVVVTLSHQGYIKYQPLNTYRAQRRGGKGKTATKVKDEDFVEKLIVSNTHDHLLCFSSIGKVYWLKAYQIPQASRISKGKPIINLLPLDRKTSEKITAILPIKDLQEELFVFMATSRGTVKKVPLNDFSRPRNGGIFAIKLINDDNLIGIDITNGKQDIMLFTDHGKVNRFNESLVRSMGRTAKGVRGIKLGKDQKVTDLVIVKENGSILTTTVNGFGKRTAISEFRTTGRGGQGVISIQVSSRNGKAISSSQVYPNDEAILISSQGTMVRIRVEEVSLVGRNTQGVKLINLNEGEKLVALQRVEEMDLINEIEENEKDNS